MRPTRTLALAAPSLAILCACLTINVYFPEAAIRDLSRQIEEEVRRQAATMPAPPAPEAPDSDPAETPDEAPRSLLEGLLGVTEARAQESEVPAPGVSSPAIRRIIASRAARVAELDRYKRMGVIGENKDGLVEPRNLETLADLKARAEVQRLVKAENADREELFREIAAAKGVDLSQLPRIRETYAATLRDRAKPGDWIQAADGTWKQK